MLTPGEIMQLSPDDEVIMVAGSPPIRAQKARYYQDKRFTERLYSAADPKQAVQSQHSDDWTDIPVARTSNAACKRDDKIEDPANLGRRREPELSDKVEVVTTEAAPEDALMDILAESEGAAARRHHVSGKQKHHLARQTSLDPDAGMKL